MSRLTHLERSLQEIPGFPGITASPKSLTAFASKDQGKRANTTAAQRSFSMY